MMSILVVHPTSSSSITHPFFTTTSYLQSDLTLAHRVYRLKMSHSHSPSYAEHWQERSYHLSGQISQASSSTHGCGCCGCVAAPVVLVSSVIPCGECARPCHPSVHRSFSCDHMRPISSSSYTSAPFRSPSTCSLPQQSRKFRPLPLVPTPLSIAIATEDSDSSRPSSPRPLPVPPTYSSQPSSPSQSPLSSPLTPYSSRSLSLSSNTPRGPNSTRSDLLTPLKIPVLCRSSLSSVSTGQTLVTPISPACPSPFTTKRRRFSKLRRHFGEAPPYDLVFPSDGGPAGVSCPDTTSEGIVDIKPPSHHPCYEGGQNIDVGNDGCEGESESGSGSDGGNDEEHGDECCEMGYVLECANEAPQCTTKRFSAKWVQEKKGRRYTEKDYDGLLHRLRKL